MPRPIILGVVGDSAAGKTTLTRGLVRILGEDGVNHIGTDDYHRYDRTQRKERGITPLHPDCNYLDVMTHDLRHVRSGEAILKPVYQHADGTFGPPEYVEPKPFAVVEGLLGYHTTELSDVYDLRVFLAPPEKLRRHWKVQRDCSRRGYTTDQVLEELDRREPDSEEFIRPQENKAHLVVSFTPREDGSPESLDAELVLREGLSHPDLAPIVGDGQDGITVEDHARERHLSIPGDIDARRADEIEATIWERMRFASHLNTERLGEFTIGTDLHRSNSLAIAQVLIVYHLVNAKASVALGGDDTREGDPQPVVEA
ncbi:phosphoribulokinase [soil metagenome]